MSTAKTPEQGGQQTNLNLEPYWMPFTGNRYFKRHPRLIEAASGVHCTTVDGRTLLDGAAGMWCCNAGHCHPKIVAAVQEQVAKLDYAMAFQLGHPSVFELAERLTAAAPQGFDYAFFVNSGSEAADTALKIALGYHRARGEGARVRLIGRERGYHGVGLGGMSVGGISPNRKTFAGALLPAVDHLPHTHDLQRNAFSRGQPEHGAERADALEHLVALHDASNIAAVIVEPVAGSAGVLLPPKGYLERLREICTAHGILLIFDEVITGFGRVGASFATERFGVMPDIMTMAKGLTSGVVPMGAILVRREIYEAFMSGPEEAIELFHGYTYSGHPVAAAAARAALEVYAEEELFERARQLEPVLEDALHALRGARHVIDVRNLGLVGAVELEPAAGAPGRRGAAVFRGCFDRDAIVRVTGDTIALSPPLIIEESQIRQIVDTVDQVLGELD